MFRRICVRGRVGKGIGGWVGFNGEGWVDDGEELFVAYCGRKMGRFGLEGSELGNKFIEGGKEENIRKYKVWLWGMIKGDDELVVGELERLLDLEKEIGVVWLGCWCGVGENCHCDVLINCLNWLKGGGGGLGVAAALRVYPTSKAWPEGKKVEHLGKWKHERTVASSQSASLPVISKTEEHWTPSPNYKIVESNETDDPEWSLVEAIDINRTLVKTGG